MALSRRGFFKGAAATGATIATGGTSAIAGGAASAAVAAGAGLAATFETAKTMAEKVALAQRILGTKKGGYPFHDIEGMFRRVFHRPNAGWSTIDVPYANQIRDVILGKGDFFRHDSPDHGIQNKQGKIDFSAESVLFDRLFALPDDIPLDVLLSDELYDTVEKRHVYGSATPEQRQYLRDFLKPIIDDGGGVQDLKKAFEGHFIRLAKHALSHPGDFVNDGYLRPGGKSADDVSVVTGDISRLLDIVNNKTSYEGREALANGVREAWKDHIQNVEKPQIFERVLKEKERQATEFEARLERIREEQLEKILKPWLRKEYEVDLRDIGEGRFVVQFAKGRAQRDLLRIDWYHWVEALDPDNKKICDIGLDETGAILTVKNPVALEFLKNALAKERGNVVSVKLPNRRTGVDLNDPPEFGAWSPNA